MDRILFGDNQFFSINHVSEHKANLQSIKFKEDKSILDTIDDARIEGIETFMCTTHDRMNGIAENIRSNKEKYSHFSIYPCMPYAHKYANAITEHGILKTIKQYIPGNFFNSLFKGGMAVFSKDYISLMELMIDSEMKMFIDINTPVIFLQNVVTDLLLGLQMNDIFSAFCNHVKNKYNAEPGFITMNMPKLLGVLENIGITNPIICCSINKTGFRMSGGIDQYESVLKLKEVRIIAMQVLGGGSIPVKDAIEYVCQLPNVESILFGASSKQNIHQTVALINEFDNKYKLQNELVF